MDNTTSYKDIPYFTEWERIPNKIINPITNKLISKNNKSIINLLKLRGVYKRVNIMNRYGDYNIDNIKYILIAKKLSKLGICHLQYIANLIDIDSYYSSNKNDLIDNILSLFRTKPKYYSFDSFDNDAIELI